LSQNPVVAAATLLAEPVLSGMGLELVEIECSRDGQGWSLNVYIDKPGGVSLDDCEAASRALDPILDADIRTAGKYDYFCVSSPGLDRPLKTDRDLNRALGEEVELKLYAPINNKKKAEGVLDGFDAENITVGAVAYPRKNIALVRRAVHF